MWKPPSPIMETFSPVRPKVRYFMGLPVPIAAGSAAETAAWIDSRIWSVVKGSIATAAVFNKSRRSICVSFRPVVQIEPSLLIDCFHDDSF
jgi:hypothetical protein